MDPHGNLTGKDKYVKSHHRASINTYHIKHRRQPQSKAVRIKEKQTDCVQLLLQGLDLRFDLIQKTLHSLVAADGTTRRP